MYLSHGAILWTQFSYTLWQFVRVAKIFRIPYAILNSLLACCYFCFTNQKKVILPFQRIRYLGMSAPGSRQEYFETFEKFTEYGTRTSPAVANQSGELESGNRTSPAAANQSGELESGNRPSPDARSQIGELESGNTSSPAPTSQNGDLESGNKTSPAATSQHGELESCNQTSPTTTSGQLERGNLEVNELSNARFEFSDIPFSRLPRIWVDQDDQQRDYEEMLLIRKCKLRLNGEEFSFLLKGKKTFLLNICQYEPVLFCAASDMIISGLSIVEPMDQEDALKKIVCGGYIPTDMRDERVLPIWRVKDELNRNFIRILSTLPLVAQANGRRELSYFFFLGVLGADQLGILLEKVHQALKQLLFHVFKKVVSELISSPTFRLTVCDFFSTFDEELGFSRGYPQNFVRIKKGQEFLVSNVKACQLGGDLGEFIEHHAPNGQAVASSTFGEEVVQLELQNGNLMEFASNDCDLYEIDKFKLFIEKAGRGDINGDYSISRGIDVFCSDICVHSGYIDECCVFYMLNAVKLVVEKGHMPVHSVKENVAQSVYMNDFISKPACFLSIQVFKAKKSMWIR